MQDSGPEGGEKESKTVSEIRRVNAVERLEVQTFKNKQINNLHLIVPETKLKLFGNCGITYKSRGNNSAFSSLKNI